jgi:tetratricopeptide (TPR) repeat protein
MKPVTLLLAAIMFSAGATCAHSQESKPTIRHHRVEEPAEDASAPELAQAEDAMQHNDFAAAEPLLQKAVAAKPNDYRAWFDLGYIYAHTGRPREAIDAYRKAVAAKPEVFESNLNLGLLLANSNGAGDSAESAKYLKAATQLKPTAHPQESLMTAWMALGQVEETQEPTQALLAFAQAAKLNPADPGPHVAAGKFYELYDCRVCPDVPTEARLNFAIKEYKTALEIDATSVDALRGLERIYERLNNYAEAEIVLRKLLALNPRDPSARLYLAKALSAQGKNDEAVQELQTGLQANPGDPHAALELGTLYVKAGKDADAEQQFRVAVQKLPQDPEAHFALGSLLLHEKKFAESQQELQIAVRLKPDLAEGYSNLAVAASSNKNYTLAMQALDMRAKFLPETPATYFLRAATFDNLKQIPQAVEYYQKFLAVDGGQFPDQEWQARHRLIAIDPKNADKYRLKK